MDTTKEYIKMCEESLRYIDKEYSPSHERMREMTYAVDGKVGTFVEVVNRRNCTRAVPLWEIEHLHEMLPPESYRGRFEANYTTWYRHQPAAYMDDKSLDQMRLMYVMEVKYGRVWDGTSWTQLPGQPVVEAAEKREVAVVMRPSEERQVVDSVATGEGAGIREGATRATCEAEGRGGSEEERTPLCWSSDRELVGSGAIREAAAREGAEAEGRGGSEEEETPDHRISGQSAVDVHRLLAPITLRINDRRATGPAEAAAIDKIMEQIEEVCSKQPGVWISTDKDEENEAGGGDDAAKESETAGEDEAFSGDDHILMANATLARVFRQMSVTMQTAIEAMLALRRPYEAAEGDVLAGEDEATKETIAFIRKILDMGLTVTMTISNEGVLEDAVAVGPDAAIPGQPAI